MESQNDRVGGQDGRDCGQLSHVAQAHHMISPMASHKTPEEEAPLQRFSKRKHAGVQ